MVHALMHVHVLEKLITNLTTHMPVLMQDTLLFGVQQLFHLRVLLSLPGTLNSTIKIIHFRSSNSNSFVSSPITRSTTISRIPS